MKRLSAIAGLATVLIAGSAWAVPLKWTLVGVTFDDGGTASGSFVFDADTKTYSAINIITTAGTTRAGAVYTAENSNRPSNWMELFVLTAEGDGEGNPAAVFSTFTKTNDGGTLPLSIVTSEGGCNVPCATGSAPIRSLTGGSITTNPPAAVPTMPQWAMILFGMILAGWAALTVQRRRSTV